MLDAMHGDVIGGLSSNCPGVAKPWGAGSTSKFLQEQARFEVYVPCMCLYISLSACVYIAYNAEFWQGRQEYVGEIDQFSWRAIMCDQR